MLCAENRKEMEDWMSSLKSVQTREPYEVAQFNVEHFSGMHNWYACSHARPTFCNVCRESLSGVTSHGLSCEGTVALSPHPPMALSCKPAALSASVQGTDEGTSAQESTSLGWGSSSVTVGMRGLNSPAAWSGALHT
uniref:Diacylglycerol kinase eta n=2 Tax=Canis lupus familiaris TaxID=9615 RepID=A0A8I3NJQ5_CANLF